MGREISRRTEIVRPDMSGPRVDTVAARPAGKHTVRIEPRGLGDLVELWAKPVAVWIDARLGSDRALRCLVMAAVRVGLVRVPLAGCTECSRRRRFLNQVVPDWRRWREWAAAPARLFRALQRAFRPVARHLPGDGTGL